jgi:hypothetical protein
VFARVDLSAIRLAEQYLESGDREEMSSTLSVSYAALEERQPAIATRIADVLKACTNDAARGLGVYLAISVWLSFLQEMEHRILPVTDNDFKNAELFLKVDAEVRQRSPNACIDTDDIVAMHQPALAGFVRERLDETLRTYENEIDIDQADNVYQLILTEILALSYAVEAPPDSVREPTSLS